MGDYTGICKLRGGEGCTAMPRALYYCQLRAPANRNLFYCTSSNVDINELMDVSDGYLYGDARVRVLVLGSATIARPARLEGVAAIAALQTYGTMSSLLASLTGTAQLAVATSGVLSYGRVLSGDATAQLSASGLLLSDKSFSGSAVVALQTTGAVTTARALAGNSALALATAGVLTVTAPVGVRTADSTNARADTTQITADRA